MTDNQRAQTSPVRVLHLTDPHLFSDEHGELRGVVTADSLARVLDDYRASGWQADIAAVTGDLIQDDSAGAYRRFTDMLAPLGLPVHCVPGNHDIRAVMQDALEADGFEYCASVEIGNWLILGIDSCVSESAGGAVTAEELDRMDAVIAASTAPHILVCLHHPPVPMGSRWLDGVGLADGDAFLERLSASGRVRLAIFGHVHQDYDAEHSGIRIIATPSTCRQFAPHSEEFAMDDRPPAWRRIELHDDGSLDAELNWLSDA